MLDYYCAGCLLYELVYSAPPFYSKNVEQIFVSVINEEVTFPPVPRVSNEFKDFIRNVLKKDPT